MANILPRMHLRLMMDPVLVNTVLNYSCVADPIKYQSQEHDSVCDHNVRHGCDRLKEGVFFYNVILI